MRRLAFAVLAHVAAVDVVSECSCARVPELETEVQDLRAQMKAQQTQTDAQQAHLKALEDQMKALMARLPDASTPGTTTVGVSSSGVTMDEQAHEEARRLSASGEGFSLATRGWQTHVFPDGHSCPNMATGRPIQLLPVNNQSATTWNPSPLDLPYAANVSLSSIENDWTTSEVQSFPNPINIVHDASCSSLPTLELPLATTISQLTVTGPTTLSHPLTINGAAVRVPALEQSLTYTHSGTLATTNEICCTDIPGLAKTLVLSQTSKVIVTYTQAGSISSGGSWRYIFTYLKKRSDSGSGVGAWTTLDAASSVYGVSADVAMGTNDGMWIGELVAGSHEFMVTYTSSGDVNPYSPWTMTILVL